MWCCARAALIGSSNHLVQEKSDAAELVLDGRLIGERTEEVNLAELLQVARREFNEKDHTLDEALLQAEWPKLRAKLTTAMQGWETGFIEAPAEVEPVTSAVIINAATGFTPSEPPVVLPTVLPHNLLAQSAKIIPFPLPTPNWQSRLRQAARPCMLKILSGTTHALFQKQLSNDELRTLLDELTNRGVVKVSDGKLNYERGLMF